MLFGGEEEGGGENVIRQGKVLTGSSPWGGCHTAPKVPGTGTMGHRFGSGSIRYLLRSTAQIAVPFSLTGRESPPVTGILLRGPQ